MKSWMMRAAGAGLAVSAMGVPVWAACYKPAPMSCSASGGGYCQGTVTVCEAGWMDGVYGDPGAILVIDWALQAAFCSVSTSCGPGPCNGNIPPDANNVGCAPNSNGQCCWCESTGEPYQSSSSS
jgi:hypothetical protein